MALQFYAKDNEIRTILYNDMKINNIEYSPVNVCFVCDVTGSMDKYIDSIKATLIDFINYVSNEVSRTPNVPKPRVAFVLFKDKKDKKPIEIIEFDTDYEKIVKLIEGIECEGGDDTCEDIVTALRETLKLKWTSDLNLVYLIADAPPHGKSYYVGNYSDDYPEDDKGKPLENLASHYGKNRIHLGVLKCNDSVDKMIDILKERYNKELGRLITIEINKDDHLKKDYRRFFLESLKAIFAQSFIPTRYNNFGIIREKGPGLEETKDSYEVEFETLFRGKVNTGSIKGLNFEHKEYNYSIEFKSVKEAECKISGIVKGSGVFSDCYPLHVDTNTNYVAKVPNKKNKKAKEVKDLFPEIETTLITQLLADKFTILLKQAIKNDKGNQTICPSIKVIPLTIIERLNSRESKGQSFFLAQQLLAGEYIKFNNNYGWKNPDLDSYNLIAQAFSHFTYEYTTGVLMVTDIQGIKTEKNELIITDPAIHSFLYKQQFGGTNHGKLGMIRFFMTHQCNDYCKMLNLIHPNSIDFTTVQSIKEKRKGEKGLHHLYEKFELKVEEWRKAIQSFSMEANPESNPIKEESDEDCGRTTCTVQVTVKSIIK